MKSQTKALSATLELLADAMVRLTEHDECSRETIRRRLEENELNPWRKDMLRKSEPPDRQDRKSLITRIGAHDQPLRPRK